MSNVINQVIMWICVAGLWLIALLSKYNDNIEYALLLAIIVFITISIDYFYTKKEGKL